MAMLHRIHEGLSWRWREWRRGNYPKHRVRHRYQSETSKCRARLGAYCVGCGVDLGPGGDPINATAIRVDLPTPYADVGDYQVQLGGSADHLYWFRDETLDYVFSSHLLEDFEDTRSVLMEWLRVLKPGGRLVLFCPDEQVYAEHCRRTGQRHNDCHRHKDFSLARVKRDLESIGQTRILHENALIDVYSWEIVCAKVGQAQ